MRQRIGATSVARSGQRGERGLSQIQIFLTTLLAAEKAWASLDAVEAHGSQELEEAVSLGSASAQLLTRVAGLLSVSQPERAHEILQQAAALDGAPAPTQLALSRSFRAQGHGSEASHWLQGAMLRARPDGALLLELAAIELDHARSLVDAARAFPCRDASTAQDAALALIASGKRKEGRIAGDIAFKAGARAPEFLFHYSALLADRAMRADPPLPAGPLGMPHWWNIATHAAQARLTADYPPTGLLPVIRAREESGQWVNVDALSSLLAERIARAEPFSWIRLGDGEARFLLHLDRDLRRAIAEHEAEGMARQIWHVWFGQDITSIPERDLTELGQRLDRSIRDADLLGVTTVDRLIGDSTHYGFCAGLEVYLQRLLAPSTDRLFTDALAPITLNERDPFLSSLLGKLDFLGVISPHADLGDRLQRKLGIPQVKHYEIPGEGRLERSQEFRNRDAHYPDVYQQMMAQIDVPRRGAVYLVAGGLLGKIYCDRIRELGGIALDIGAIADAWMGHNTRGGVLEASMRRQLPA